MSGQSLKSALHQKAPHNPEAACTFVGISTMWWLILVHFGTFGTYFHAGASVVFKIIQDFLFPMPSASAQSKISGKHSLMAELGKANVDCYLLREVTLIERPKQVMKFTGHYFVTV